MQFEITINLYVDRDANFLGSDSDFFHEDIEDLLRQTIYDIDDVEIRYIEVLKDKD